MNKKFTFKNIIFNISIQKLNIYPFGICPNRNSKWNYSRTHQIDYKVYYQISTYNQTVCSVINFKSCLCWLSSSRITASSLFSKIMPMKLCLFLRILNQVLVSQKCLWRLPPIPILLYGSLD